MTFIRKSIALAWTAIASFFEADRHPLLGASALISICLTGKPAWMRCCARGLVAQVANEGASRKRRARTTGTAAPPAHC